MTFRDASEAIERIAESGIKSPFTFWVLLAVTLLGLIMAGGSFWLLGQQLGAHDSRYARLFEVLATSAEKADKREEKMIDELQITRRDYSANLQAIVEMLMREAPTKIDATKREAALSRIEKNQQTLELLQERQDRILLSLDQIKIYMAGKTGR